ncbi:MAG: branched-chain amino acid ABC transporter permease [Acidobacteriia bacterium]|nr:branched-chain amino acid ABC transporter permease [Methyloceanibacter sp.]MCL6490597.1 branched-chain amino acid ABC transporter permease [Terriglobia bacterium]
MKPSERTLPVLLVLLIAALGFAAMPFTDWLTLSAAGLAMGMMLFLMVAGLTLIFGLMDVLNFAHGAFITFGAFAAGTVFARFPQLVASDRWEENLLILALAALAAALLSGALGFGFERVAIGRVYGAHLRQILLTTGALIVAEQLAIVIWGPDAIPVLKPAGLRGSFLIAGAAIEKYRVVAALFGLFVFLLLQGILAHTRIGIIVRAGVENREMVEALGYRIRPLFAGVFVAGAALAGVGGAMWATYAATVTASLGSDLTVLIFIVVIIGGLGSVGGSFLGALLVGLVTNYVGFLAPKLALLSNILLMAAILLWRPRGLLAAGGR